ncbi:DUF6777 domain-containing protein [Streptomyces sp. NPDC052682]|uniref:DUF6777 domain-containing protein n=1 Tax=Streptomyces sp. NPDC052682 TaxID=3154954 RepID=UPI00343E043C
MSVEPPSSGRPTGPPSGPLSGPSQPPAQPPPGGPPSQPPGGGGQPPRPRRPWWRSAPRVAVLATAVVAAVLLAVVFSRSGGGGSDRAAGEDELFLQPAAKAGPDPFTESTAKESSAPPVTPSPSTGSAPPNAVRPVRGGTPGLYGGTRNAASCDVEKQISYLRSSPAKNRAFASVLGLGTSDVPSYVRALTPVQLRTDTWVTNHGYRDGAATSYQAVLQAGTAVLVDDRGVPRVRCACGNPLTPPVPLRTVPKRVGDSWPWYRPSNVVMIKPAPRVIKVFIVQDPDTGEWFHRQRGDTGDKDRKTEPPEKKTPSASVSTPTPPSSEPPSSESPSSDSQSPDSPSSDSPSSEPPPSSPPSSSPEPGPSEPASPDTSSPSESGTPSPEGPLAGPRAR